jgi:predicted SAM-dependent methyltransferase
MKLHLGSGKRFLSGFKHIDIAEFPHIDHISSVDSLGFIAESSVSEIYCSHTLEYFDRHEVGRVLTGWLRILEPGGQLFLTVPDFDSLLQVYEKTKSLSSIIGPLFGRWVNLDSHMPIFHRTVWNEMDLSDKLKEVGFEEIQKFDPVTYLSAIDIEYDDYSLAYFPHMDRSGIQVSLAISCRRPLIKHD